MLFFLEKETLKEANFIIKFLERKMTTSANTVNVRLGFPQTGKY